jgi:hypothetical protein
MYSEETLSRNVAIIPFFFQWVPLSRTKISALAVQTLTYSKGKMKKGGRLKLMKSYRYCSEEIKRRFMAMHKPKTLYVGGRNGRAMSLREWMFLLSPGNLRGLKSRF